MSDKSNAPNWMKSIFGEESLIGEMGAASKLPGVGAAMFAADKLMKLSQVNKNKKIKERLESGIQTKFQNQMNKIMEQKEMEEEKLDYQYATQSDQVNVAGQQSLKHLVQATQNAQGQGFETSEETTLQTDELLANYNNEIQKLVDTRKMNMESVMFNAGKAMDRAADQRNQQMAQASKIQTRFTLADMLS